MSPEIIHFIGLTSSIIGLICGLFFFVYSVRYYLFSIFILLKDQQALDKAQSEKSNLGLGFTFSSIDMLAHQLKKNRANIRSKKSIGFKKKKVRTELLINQIDQHDLGFARQEINMSDQAIFNRVAEKLRDIFWDIKRSKDKIIVHPARIGLRKRLHQLLIMVMKKSNYEDLSSMFLVWLSALGKLFTGSSSWTVNKNRILPQTAKNIDNFTFCSRDLKFSKHQVQLGPKAKKLFRQINMDSIGLIDDPLHQPFVSIHLAFYNEENVAERVIEACLKQDYKRYEIIIADDSTDRTPQILQKYAKNKMIKVLRRESREGYKGGALKEAIKQTNPTADFIIVFDADFVPPPGSIKSFLKEFFVQNGNTFAREKENNLAAVQGYQWHVLNKDENFVTSGIRFGFSGGYMIERTAQQHLGAMKMIAGSVFIIRRDVLEKYTWQMPNGYTSIVEDWNLTIRMYIDGWKIGYTPEIRVPSECVNSLNKLARQQIRWAEGHTWNVKKYFWKVMLSPHMTLIEKIEFIFYAPFYMQAFFFIVGTIGWVIGELIFHIKVPGWTATLGWSLVFTNLMALPVMCISGLVLERGEDKDYNFLPFLTYIYYIIPHLAYASLKGLISPNEGAWVRTFKTGSVTDAVMEGQMAGSSLDLIDANVQLLNKSLDKTAKSFEAQQKIYKFEKKQTEELKKGRFWVELKRVPRLGMAIIVILAIIVGSISYLATTEITAASNDLAYLNNPNYLSPTAASSPKTVKFNRQNPSYSWYYDPCPTGNDPGGISAGNYSTTLKLTSKPQHNKTYSFTVGHVNASGGDYQYITSTNYVINQSTPSTLTISLGNGPAVTCDVEHKRKLVYTITYLSSEGDCDSAATCEAVTCDAGLAYNTDSTNERKSILPKLDIFPTAHAMAVPTCQEGENCLYLDDAYFYIPLKTSTSGVYPTKGTTSDSVSLTRSAPTSSGYLDFEYSITGIPDNFSDGSLNMHFTDLDLTGDTITSGSNVVTLYETFSLMDSNGNVLTTLNSSSGYNDNFDWSFAIPNNLIVDNSLTLKARLTSATTLTSGSGLTLTNTQEGIQSISLCGNVDCQVPETIALTAANDCNSIKLNWTKYTDQTIDGYKLLRSTTDPELTYPEDGYYQYLSGQSTISYTDTGIVQGQSYYYRIGAYKGGVIVAYSDTEHITAQSVCPIKKVSPILECVDANNDGTYTAHFGYENLYNSNLTIAIGSKNKFTPTPINRGQPSTFTPGRVIDSFQVNFNGSNLVWYLKSPNGQSATATASSSSPRCTTNCCCDDLVIEYNNGISILSCPHIIVPEATLLLGIPALVGWWYSRKKKKTK